MSGHLLYIAIDAYKNRKFYLLILKRASQFDNLVSWKLSLTSARGGRLPQLPYRNSPERSNDQCYIIYIYIYIYIYNPRFREVRNTYRLVPNYLRCRGSLTIISTSIDICLLITLLFIDQNIYLTTNSQTPFYTKSISMVPREKEAIKELVDGRKFQNLWVA